MARAANRLDTCDKSVFWVFSDLADHFLVGDRPDGDVLYDELGRKPNSMFRLLLGGDK